MQKVVVLPMTPSSPLALLLIADDPLARAGLAALLREEPGVAVAGQIAADSDLAAAVAAYRPAVVIWDMGWEPARRVEALSHFMEEVAGPVRLPVVALMTAGAPVGAAVRGAGVLGLLGREVGGDQIAAAAQAVLLGLHVKDPALGRLRPRLPDDVAMAPEARTGATPPQGAALPVAVADEALIEPLSVRELDVLRRMAEGLSNKLIARDLGISEHTVKYHVNAILGKLGAQSRTEAVVRATRIGLILL
jgi:DNA-binding NarL/FixJ family response regulator